MSNEKNPGRDEEIVVLLKRLGAGQAVAMRRLAAAKDRDRLLIQLRERWRLENVRLERTIRARENEQWSDTGREKLRGELATAARERTQRNAERHPLERLAVALHQMRLSEAGPIGTQSPNAATPEKTADWPGLRTRNSHPSDPKSSRGGAGDAKDGTMRQAPPGAFQGFCLEADWLEDLLGRVAKVAEQRLDNIRTGRSVQADWSADQRTDRILDVYEGEAPAFVAFVEQIDEKHVRQLRRKHGRHPRDGRVVEIEEAA